MTQTAKQACRGWNQMVHTTYDKLYCLYSGLVVFAPCTAALTNAASVSRLLTKPFGRFWGVHCPQALPCIGIVKNILDRSP